MAPNAVKSWRCELGNSRAAEAVETATVIRAAAVAEAVSALITADLIKESAAHEAIDAMRVAGLLVAAVDKMEAEAVAEGAAIVRAASITLAQANVLRYLRFAGGDGEESGASDCGDDRGCQDADLGVGLDRYI